jgi:acyl carrier protein
VIRAVGGNVVWGTEVGLMVTVEEVAGLIRKEIRRKLPDDQVLDASTVLDDLGMSSLEIAEVVFSLEEEHDIEFDETKAADVKTLGDVVALANDALGVSEEPVAEIG